MAGLRPKEAAPTAAPIASVDRRKNWLATWNRAAVVVAGACWCTAAGQRHLDAGGGELEEGGGPGRSDQHLVADLTATGA